MSSEELKTRQYGAFAEFLDGTRSREQRSLNPYESNAASSDTIEKTERGRASVAALRAQLAQIQMEQARSGTPLAAPVSGSVPGEQYLVFLLLDREFAIKAEYIQGVERLVDVTPVPNAASWVQGVINLRGSIASVVDLRAFLEMQQLPYNPRTRLLSVQYNEMVICLVVDSVSDMTQIPTSAIITGNTRQTAIPKWAAPYAMGTATLDTRSIVVLDAERLLFSHKMQRYSKEP